MSPNTSKKLEHAHNYPFGTILNYLDMNILPLQTYAVSYFKFHNKERAYYSKSITCTCASFIVIEVPRQVTLATQAVHLGSRKNSTFKSISISAMVYHTKVMSITQIIKEIMKLPYHCQCKDLEEGIQVLSHCSLQHDSDELWHTYLMQHLLKQPTRYKGRKLCMYYEQKRGTFQFKTK